MDIYSARCVFYRCTHRIYAPANAYLRTARYALRGC